MELLQEAAGWEKEVGEVRSVIEAAEARVANTATAVLSSSTLPQVFDGVFDEEACAAVHASAKQGGLSHTLYRREAGPATPLESALESAMLALGDEAPFVEYWWREEWKHIEAHADVDEALAAQGGDLRCPRNGHVLYLQVGGRVQGPTCVWGAPGGGATAAGDGELTVVPAVPGRLLRFPGELVHAVPRPADVWTAPFVISVASTPPEDFRRSVVLFNTWLEPPLNVTPHADAGSSAAPQPAARCRPRAEWSDAALTRREAEAHVKAKIWLLGDERRRGQPERTRAVLAPAELEAALMEPTTTTVFSAAA
jgi:hypothetical protein